MTGQSIITYSINTVLGAFPVEDILEIYRVIGFTPFERRPHRVIGFASFRGNPLYGVDVQDVFGIEGHVYDADASIIVSRVGDTLAALFVDHIGEIQRVDESLEISRDQYQLDVNERCIKNAYAIRDQAHFEIDLFNLFTEEEHRLLKEHSSIVESTLTRLYT